MQNDVIQQVERRLEEWADWYLRHNDFGLGYPKKSLEARLMETGGYLIKTTGPVYPPENVEAEEIEGLVAEIARQTPKLAQALRTQYFDRGHLALQSPKNRCLQDSIQGLCRYGQTMAGWKAQY